MAGEGNLATKISMIIGSGEGRGMGLILVLSGIILTIWGIMGFNYRPLRLWKMYCRMLYLILLFER